jgi:ATP-dependent DNA ligase
VIEQRTGPDQRAWRPQRFGHARSRGILDPIIEPLWIGDRVLVHVADGSAILRSEGGEAIDAGEGELAELREAIEAGILAASAVLDGYLTRQATARPAGEVGTVSVPTPTEMTTQMIFGSRRNPRKEIVDEDRAIDAIERADVPLAFVAVDLLEIDGSPLLDIPLLERKRLLESAVDPNLLFRVGPYVRPPVDAWLGTWRAIGFFEIAYKAANSRYRPGATSDDWATARIPRH